MCEKDSSCQESLPTILSQWNIAMMFLPTWLFKKLKATHSIN